MSDLTDGDVYTYERTFTTADVREFAELSEDRQPRHLEPDDEGRLLLHGLLTATLVTKIGGDHEVMATRMDFEFQRPVYTGQLVRCRWTNESVERQSDRINLEISAECTVAEEVVLDGAIEGIVWT